MGVKIAVLAGYFLLVLVVGFLARTRWSASPETYFLADRKFGTLVLLATMAATNFSAFTVFGTSGAGYRDGYAFFPIMGFGTGFMALSFWLLGRKIWRAGRESGSVTPPELIRHIYKSQPLSTLFCVVMIVFTIPYLALQPMAAGYALEELIGLPYFGGAAIITGIICLYTIRGGLRAVAWTDLFQGVLMLVLLLASLLLVTGYHGGFLAAHQKALAAEPGLFSRPGPRGFYTPAIWFSFMMLWFFCDPMFPQLFQRFFSAKSERTIGRMMLFYPLICTVVFFMPIAIGVLGHLSFPDLAGKEADRILPMMITLVSGDAMAALVMACGLAALMSTMDSQLLTLSSLFTRDILPLASRRTEHPPYLGRLFVILLALCGLGLAYLQPDTILNIATQTFTGLTVLFPTVFFGLYLKKVHARAAMASILAGEGALVAATLGYLPTFGFLPVVPVLAITIAVYAGLHLALEAKTRGFAWTADVASAPWVRIAALFALFLLSMDLWAWGKTGPVKAGLPLWIGYFVALSAVQTWLMAGLIRPRKEAMAETGKKERLTGKAA
ncbi:MAG: sodium:solute symporter family protein [Deltaproteobacteria bacterium]|nr:sodium:solute symporter family protein [Deltaproteobacteria bacterium]